MSSPLSSVALPSSPSARPVAAELTASPAAPAAAPASLPTSSAATPSSPLLPPPAPVAVSLDNPAFTASSVSSASSPMPPTDRSTGISPQHLAPPSATSSQSRAEAGTSEMSEPTKVRKRQTQSCDRCKLKKRRCDGNHPCNNCLNAGANCTMDIEPKKRGPKAFHDSFLWPKRKRQAKGPASSGSLSAHSQHPSDSVEDNLSPRGLVAQPHGGATTRQRSATYEQEPSSVMQISSLFNPSLSVNSFPYGNADAQLDAVSVDDMRAERLGGALSAGASAARPPRGYSASAKPVGPDPRYYALSAQRSASIDGTGDHRGPSALLDPSTRLRRDLSRDMVSDHRSTHNGTAGNGADQRSMLFPPTVEDMIQLPSQKHKHSSAIDLPKLPCEFFLHLINCFFTYFHPTLPIIEETSFFADLIPVNVHHPVLLNAIYSIGCLFSRHPLLFQPPLSSPEDASHLFALRAYDQIHQSEAKSLRSFHIAVCTGSILLSIVSYGNGNVARMGAIVGSACQIIQRFGYPDKGVFEDLPSVMGHTLPSVFASKRALKRTWWGCLLSDSFSSIGGGTSLLLNEAECIDIIRNADHIQSGRDERTDHFQMEEAWLLLRDYPANTVFNDTTPRAMEGSQADHLYTPVDGALHLVQLNAILRLIIRHNTNRTPEEITPQTANPTIFNLHQIISQKPSLDALHKLLVSWCENLPADFQFFESLDYFTPAQKPLSSLCVNAHITFFAALVLLHHGERAKRERGNTGAERLFALSSAKTMTSGEICLHAYRAHCHILQRVFQGQPPSFLTIAPIELCSSPTSALFLALTPIVLLQDQQFSRILLSPDAKKTGIDDIGKWILPALDSIGHVWKCASSYAANLRRRIVFMKAQMASSGANA